MEKIIDRHITDEMAKVPLYRCQHMTIRVGNLPQQPLVSKIEKTIQVKEVLLRFRKQGKIMQIPVDSVTEVRMADHILKEFP